MSGIYGLLRLDGQSIAPAALDGMAAALAHRGPDGNGIWHEGHVGLGCQSMKVTPESIDTRQPESDGLGACVVFDGRIDNRDELRTRLQVTSNSDTALLLTLYRRYGQNFAGELNGDYALALYDTRERRLLLARDVVGTRPVYYSRSGALLAFASEIKALLTALPGRPKPNVQYLAVNLLGGMPPSDAGFTHFKDVISLQPGHTLVCEQGKEPRTFQHSDFEVEKEIRFKRDEDYIEAFREHFFTAVKRRIRSKYPVVVSVSGGLDSSSIFCVAKKLLEEDSSLTPQLIGITHSAPEGSSADERTYVAAIERDYHVKIDAVPVEFSGMLAGLEYTVSTYEAPWADIQWQNGKQMLDRALATGARSFVGGYWGDQMMFESAYLADLARGLRIPTLMQHVRELPKWMGGNRAWLLKGAARQAVKSFIPEMVRPLIMAYRRRTAPMNRDRPWFTQWFRNEGRKHWPIYRPRKRRFISQSAKVRYQDANAKYYVQAMEIFTKSGARKGMEFLIPFLDRDLIQYLIQIPGEKTAPSGVHRGMLRLAMQGILPEEIASRRTKGSFTSIENQIVRQNYDEISKFFASNDLLSREGYVDGEVLKSTLADLPQAVPEYGCRLTWDLADLLAFNEWVRQFFRPEAKVAVVGLNGEQ
jgi:asparagine synthase (glutamine-hydrolysing)